MMLNNSIILDCQEDKKNNDFVVCDEEDDLIMINDDPDFDLLLNSNYFSNKSIISDHNKYNIYNKWKQYLFEFLIILFVNIITSFSYYNVILIDNVYTYMLFYINFMSITTIDTLPTIDRYIYYGIIRMIFFTLDFVTWFNYQFIIKIFFMILLFPSLMNYIYNNPFYIKISSPIKNIYIDLTRKIICKQLAKIINIIVHHMNLDIKLYEKDLLPYYNVVNFTMINQFLVTYIIANIFNYIDKGGMKLPVIIYKNLYMKDEYSKIRNDKLYIETIIKNKKWEKLVDVYTLNRLLRLSMSDDNTKNYMSKSFDNFIRGIFFSYNKIMLCYTVGSIISYIISSLSFNDVFNDIFNDVFNDALNVGSIGSVSAIFSMILFIQHDNKLRFLINLSLFMLASLMCPEQLLLLILCEICQHLIRSTLIDDIKNMLTNFTNYMYTKLYHNIISDIVLFLALLTNLNVNMIFICVLIIMMMKFKDFKYIKYILLLLLSSLSDGNIIHMIGSIVILNEISNLIKY